MAAVEHLGAKQETDLLPIGSDPSEARLRLAVLIPVYNGQAGLERSLASLCDDGERFDVFIVDDGSEPPIQLPPSLPFTVRLMRMPQNGGITKALNTGIAPIVEAGYKYVARLDAGDISLTGRFATQMAFLDAHPDHAVVGTHAEFVDTEGKRLFVHRPPSDHEALFRYLKRRNGIVHPSAMIRSSCLAQSGFYDERHCGAEDYELWRRFCRTAKVANLPVTYLRKEIVESQITARPLRSLTRLRVQVRYFEPLALDAYLGILRSALALSSSRWVALRAKQSVERLRGRRKAGIRIRCG